ncbi:cation efflux protein [Gautieria morchelliformis]|nr:cation efflux protein [Gautieria morchelliformis]
MLSRSTKISIFLAVDVVFFFVELVVGNVVGSLALIADSFHMLNDVIGLIVALYAIKLSKNKASPKYSYGWHRAEIVASLINSVFLLALCFSIFIEALQRFFVRPDISQPKLIVIVGCLGLATNLLGIFLFLEPSPSDGETSSKSKPDHKTESTTTDARPVVARAAAARHTRDMGHSHSHGETSSESNLDLETMSTTTHVLPVVAPAAAALPVQDFGNKKPGSLIGHRGRISIEYDDGSLSAITHEQMHRDDMVHEQSPQTVSIDIAEHSIKEARDDHELQNVVQDLEDGRNGQATHSPSTSGSMNMRALLLHVFGDALGNVGVIATGLIIWLSAWKHKYYFDPAISLVIAAIIFTPVLPLVRKASSILLQAVPSTISLESIREDIQQVDGVISVHELHVWQLSENKIIASVHVWVPRTSEYVHVARNIRKVLHNHGVHSGTIQPEYQMEENVPSKESLTTNPEHYCLIRCPSNEDCKPENACCREQSFLYLYQQRIISLDSADEPSP